MKTVSKTAARTLGKLIEAAKATGENYIKINADDIAFLPVTVERIDCGGGEIEFWAVGHWYTQNGDAMRDPEVVYAVPTYEDVPMYEYAYPVEYRQDNLGICRQLVTFDENGKPARYSPAQQAEAATFTTGWMRNIKAQQNIN